MIQKPVTLKFDEFCFQNCTNLNFTRFSEAIISIWLDLGFNPNNMKKKGFRIFLQIWFNPKWNFFYKFSGNTAFLRPPFTENTNLLGVKLNHVTQIAELSHILTRPIYWACTYLLMSFWSNLAGNSNLLEYEAIRGKNLDFFFTQILREINFGAVWKLNFVYLDFISFWQFCYVSL